MPLGEFDTDAKALKQRLECNEKYGSRDLNEWVFNNLKLTEGLKILDLGCGTGKQTLEMAKVIGRTGMVVAVDISQEALDALFAEASRRDVRDKIKTWKGDIDELEALEETGFDRIVACYSLYYTKKPDELFSAIEKKLKPKGIFFFCGPAMDNNLELIKFHSSITGKAPETEAASVFMEDAGQRFAREFFQEIKVLRFENPLQFDSSEAVYSYWSSHNMYEKGIDSQFKNKLLDHFRNNRTFKNVKRAVGVLSKK